MRGDLYSAEKHKYALKSWLNMCKYLLKHFMHLGKKPLIYLYIYLVYFGGVYNQCIIKKNPSNPDFYVKSQSY